MKTKLSTKFISVILSVLMVVTAVPMSVFATANDDAAVTAVRTQMTAFETAIADATHTYTNILPAYNAYVNCQKAIDAYQYGGNTSALNGVASALQTAMNNMGEYDSTPDITSKIPTFANSTESDMRGYVGPGQPLNNILHTGQATLITGGTLQNAHVDIYYYNNTVLLYDGSTTAAMPVFFKAYVDAKKNRYVYSVYPVSELSVVTSDSGNLDFDVLQFNTYWRAGDTGNSSTANVDWNWNWWSNTYTPAYSHDTGNVYQSKNTAGHRSQKLDYTTNWIGSYNGHYERTGANALTVVSAPADYGAEYKPNWYVSTGDSANSANDVTVYNGEDNATIKVVNYKTLADNIATYYGNLRAISMSNYKEGGLSNLISKIDAATSYDVTANFTSGDGFTTTVAEMKTLVSNMKEANRTVSNYKDSTSYANLRSAVTPAIINQGEQGNTGYTTDSWAKFETAYTAVKTIFANVLSNGYTYTESTSDMDGMTYATALPYYYNALVTNVEYEDTSALMAALETFDVLDSTYFTSASYSSVKDQLDAIKIAVWGSLANYGVTTAGPEKSDEAAAMIAQYASDVPTIMRALRISPDAVAKGNGFSMSLNSAVGWQVSNVADNGMPKYSNYADFTTAQQNLSAYGDLIARTPFTDFATQYAEYVTEVGKVNTAYKNLRYTFFGIDDGAVANMGSTTTMSDMTHTHGRYTVTLTPSYTSSATLIKMNHEATTADFGYFYLKNKIYNDGDNIKDNNGIDSISINASYSSVNEINSATATSTPNAVDNAQSNYPGLLASGGFSVHNFGVEETNGVQNSFFARMDGDEYVYDVNSPNYDIVFGTSNGAKANPAIYSVNIKEGAQKQDAYITYKANFAVDLPASTAVTGGNFTTSTGPSTYDLTYTNAKFGAFYVWNSQPSLAYAGYGSAVSEDTFNISVHVIDASNLVDLYSYISAWLEQTDANGFTNAQKYDGVTGTNGINQRLAEASDELDITHLTTSAIETRLTQRYNNLLKAWNAKTLKTFTVDFIYNVDATHTTTESITVNYGETLTDYASQVSAIVANAQASEYSEGIYKYTFKGWQDEDSLDMTEHITFNDTHTAVYNQELGLADFTTYNANRAELEGKLADNRYTVAQLASVNALINGDKYYYYTDAQKAETTAAEQTDITAAAAAIKAMSDALVEVKYSSDTISNAEYISKALQYDKDEYTVNFVYLQDQTVGNDSYVGYIYDASQIDQAMRDALNGKVNNSYKVYVNGVESAQSYPYGTALKVNLDGTIEVVDTVEPDNSKGAAAAWYYCYSAPSTDNAKTASKYYSTAPSFSFYVQGNTYIESVASEETDDTFPITFAANLNGTRTKTFAASYADAATGEVINVPEMPCYAGYVYSGTYTIQSDDPDATYFEEEGVWYATAVMTVVFDYEVEPHKDDAYDVAVVFADLGDLYMLSDYAEYVDILGVEPSADLAEKLKTSFDYNEKVQFITEEFTDAVSENLFGEPIYCYAVVSDADAYAADENFSGVGVDYTLTPLTYENEYLFYAYQQLYIVPLTENQYMEVFNYEVEDITISHRDSVVPVYNTSGAVEKFSLVASFAAGNEDVSVVEYGYLFTSDTTTTADDLTLEKVGTNGVARMKSTKLTCGNQFVVNIKNPARTVEFNYVAYVTYKDGTGATTTVYSPVINGSNTF